MIVAQKDYNYQYPPYTSYEKGSEKKAKKNAKLKNLVLVAIIASLSLLVLYRYALIYEKSLAIDKLEKQIQYTENINQQLRAEIASMSNPARIEEIAKERLKMQVPEKNQIVYVKVEYVPNMAKNEVSETMKRTDSFFMRLLGVFNR
ncbi:MAG: cell division protein FtsL [Caldanaerobacter sp.]|uniref:cell division protein FtsL n=1 Tax=Caldanaerobacter sp. TaxID=2930036 RepID=UPI003C7653F8